MSADGEAPSPRFFAVVFGIDRYVHAAALHGAVRDASLVFDALCRTRMAATRVVAERVVTGGADEPRREGLVAALNRVAAEARACDTVLVFFAGHGVVADGQVALVPADGDPQRPETLLTVADVQEVFARSACPRRALLLDACQEGVLPGGDAAVGSDPAALRPAGARQPCRARGVGTVPAAAALGAAQGWTILTSCGPGQLSLESEELGGHGIFSYYVALGLRGEADLDGDGTVGLGELAQYVSNQVPREAALLSAGFLCQVPQLFCSGQIAPFSDPGSATGDALLPDRRSLRVPRGFGHDWWRAWRNDWPFERLTGWPWLVHGTALLYGLALGVEVLLAGWRMDAHPWILAGLMALAGGGLWLAAHAFMVAAALRRYHHGGYLAGTAFVVWHTGAFALATSLLRLDPGAVILLGSGLFASLCTMVVWAVNPTAVVLSLLDLERRREEGVLRRFFRDLDTRLMRAELPNPIACETIHPRLYLRLWGVTTVVLLAHMGMRLRRPVLAGEDGLVVLRDAILWVLVTWLTSGYHAAYRFVARRHPKQVTP